jgi:hypothetical protein
MRMRTSSGSKRLKIKIEVQESKEEWSIFGGSLGT